MNIPENFTRLQSKMTLDTRQRKKKISWRKKHKTGSRHLVCHFSIPRKTTTFTNKRKKKIFFYKH